MVPQIKSAHSEYRDKVILRIWCLTQNFYFKRTKDLIREKTADLNLVDSRQLILKIKGGTFRNKSGSIY